MENCCIINGLRKWLRAKRTCYSPQPILNGKAQQLTSDVQHEKQSKEIEV